MNNKNFTLWFYLLSFLAGASLVFAFAPIGLYPIAWLSPAILFYTLLFANDKKQHFFLAWLYGIGMFATGASWIFVSMNSYAHASIPVAATFTIAFVIIVALTIGLFGLLAYLFRHHHKVTRLLLFYPFSWVLIEWFRGWFLTGFPWLYLGNSQIDSVLVHIAPITGVLGVSLLSALVAGAIVALFILKKTNKILWINHPTSNHVKIKQPFRYKHQFIALFIIITIFSSTWYGGKISWTQAKGEPITVSLIQGNILQEEKWLPENKQPTLDLYKKLTKENWGSDLIIWPETAIPDLFSRNMKEFIVPLQEQAKANNTDLILGAFYQNEQGKIENSVLALTQDGRDIYSKQHLVPFSEYIPLLGYLRWLNEWVQMPSDNLTAGTGTTTLNLSGNIAQLSICYEDAFASENLKGLPLANMLINVSNDGWFTGSLEPYQHMEIARMRAIETGRYLLRSTNIGVSGIVNNKGELIATAPPYSTAVITHKVQPYSGSTPFMYWGNLGIIGLLILLLSLGHYTAAIRKPERE
ncbi:MAG TPA: apolipoprotein N-acyltransferase [Leucothrix mucor]|nr:apolipoprotein N-acyltransferase [Leucothrix mucor]